ncbi:MAG: PAS domain-containing protein [Fimbriimonas sp.]|nr:PAS domain-containing protein [Fimbriimonas sp.]
MAKGERDVTKATESRRHAAARRDQDQAFLSAIFQNADSAIVVFDRQGVILRVNPAYTAITGFTEADLVGKRYMDVMVPDGLIEAAHEKLSQIVQLKETIHCETPWKRKQGGVCLLKGCFTAILNPEGEIESIVGIGIDVTSEREAQAALLWSRKGFELAAEGSQDGIWDIDTLSGTHYYSPRWKEIIGYKDHELPNQFETWINRIHPDDIPAVTQYRAGFTENRDGLHEVEFRMRHKDGTWRWIVSRGKAVYDDEGNIVRVAGSHKDITQQKHDEMALKESQARLLEAQDIANLGAWELDLVTDDVWWSPKTYEIYGMDSRFSPPTMEDLQKTIHPEDRDRVRASIRHTMETGDPYRVKRRIYRPNGEMRYVVTSARILYDAEGVRSRVVGVVQDVTEQQIAEDAIMRAREQAIEASRLKSEFLANMSHEIRTPMNGVIGMAEMLLDSNLTQDQRQCAYTIRTSADGLMTILNDILDFSKIEAGKLALEDDDIDVLEIVEDVATIVGRSSQEKGLDLRIDADWSSPAQYRGDSTRIRQILTNLTSNAVKFTSQGSVTLGLRTSAEGVQLWVEDTGLGIAEERHQAIFDSFTQADGSTTRRYGGTGLGLAIVRQLVELMKGSVRLTSQPNKGSRFDVFLPLEQSESRPIFPILNGHRVVLLTSNMHTKQYLSRFLTGIGANVSAHEDPCEVAPQVQAETSISVIVDDESIDRDTWGSLQEISNGNNVNLVLLTVGGVSPPPGFDGTIAPPFTRKSVEHVLLERTDQFELDLLNKPALFAGMTVLLAEDNAVNQTVAVHQLERMGFQVDSVVNGRAAVEFAQKGRYDAILMDVQMPEMDGLTATGLIRKNEPDKQRVVILAMTAHAMQGDRERCIDAGMDDYISKPVRPQELVEKLMAWLKPESREASRLNWEYLHDMSNNDPEFEKEILRVYLTTMPPLMEQLSRAIRTQSHALANRVSHTLIGSSRSIGANHFADTCQEVESLSEIGQPYRHVERLERQFEELIAECLRYTAD